MLFPTKPVLQLNIYANTIAPFFAFVTCKALAMHFCRCSQNTQSNNNLFFLKLHWQSKFSNCLSEFFCAISLPMHMSTQVTTKTSVSFCMHGMKNAYNGQLMLLKFISKHFGLLEFKSESLKKICFVVLTTWMLWESSIYSLKDIYSLYLVKLSFLHMTLMFLLSFDQSL